MDKQSHTNIYSILETNKENNKNTIKHFDNSNDLDFVNDHTNNKLKWKHSFFADSDKKYKTLDMYAPPMSFPNFNNNQKKNKFVIKDVKNKKKLLCNNVITTKSCCYGSKCMYAHTLEEQQIDINRKKAYDILFSNSDLKHINFQNDISLFRSLRDLTKQCEKKYCTGGYNCKHGICGDSNKQYIICIQDLEYGDCLNKNCSFVHLTKRGLNPFYTGYANKQHTHNATVNKLNDIQKTNNTNNTDNTDNTNTNNTDNTHNTDNVNNANNITNIYNINNINNADTLKNETYNTYDIDDLDLISSSSSNSIEEHTFGIEDEYNQSIFDKPNDITFISDEQTNFINLFISK